MSFRAFLILAGLTVVALAGAAWAVVSEHLSSAGQQVAAEPVLAALASKPGDVAKITIAGPNYEIALEHRDDTWLATTLGDYPAKPEMVASLVSGLASLRAYEVKTDNPDWYKDIDVDDPGEDSEGILITASAADGTEMANVIVGKPSESIGSSQGGTFLRTPGEAASLLAQGSVAIPPFLQNWFDGIVHVPGPQVRRVTVLEGETVVFDTEKIDPTTGDYELVSLDPKYGEPGSLANDNAIKSMSQGIVSTTFENARPRDSITYAADARTVRFKMADELQIDLKLGEADGETWVTYTASAPEGTEGAKRAEEIAARTDRWAFRLPSYRVAVLQKPITELVEAAPEPPPEEAPADPRFLTNNPLIPVLPGQEPAGLPPGLPGLPLVPGN